MYDVHVYLLHSPSSCAARVAMCKKLHDVLASTSKFRASITEVTVHEPGDLRMQPPEAVAALVDTSPDALKDQPDLAREARSLHVTQLSCCLKHAQAIQMIAQRVNEGGYHLVLEDDVMFSDTVADQLDALLRVLPTDYDVVFLGMPSPGGQPSIQTCVPLGSIFEVLPACDSYLVSPHAAAKMLTAFTPVRLLANLSLTLAIRRHTLKAYSASPNLFADGSKVGVYVSQVDPNNRLTWNEQFIKLEALCNGRPPATPTEIQEAQAFIDTLQFKTHPDVLRLLGRLQMRMGNFKEAEALFKQVHAILIGEGCVVNSNSTFLKDFMTLYRHLQPDV